MVNLTRQTSSNLINIVDESSIREEFAGYLSQMAKTLTKSEAEGEQYSGRLGFERDIANLNQVSEDLRQGVFRILVFGDWKRGKTNLLNALIGEPVLPTGINPCTAVITIVRYGNNKQVTIHFNDGKPSESIDFQTFNQPFTVPPDYEEIAFPDIERVVIEYPLEILKNGIEFITFPGLRETEASLDLRLNYINNCHAILFVLSAKSQFTMYEHRFLDNYLKDKGLTIFFPINYWNCIHESLLDPDDKQEVAEAETKVRQHFKTNLLPYCQVNGKNLYNQRVFELNALAAFQARRQQTCLKGTGFEKFISALNEFVTEQTNKRLKKEILTAKKVARKIYQAVHEAATQRSYLLREYLNKIEHKITRHIISNMGEIDSESIKELEQELAGKKAATELELSNLEKLETNILNKFNCLDTAYNQFLNESYY